MLQRNEMLNDDLEDRCWPIDVSSTTQTTSALRRLRFFNSQLSFVEDETTVNNLAREERDPRFGREKRRSAFLPPFLETLAEQTAQRPLPYYLVSSRETNCKMRVRGSSAIEFVTNVST